MSILRKAAELLSRGKKLKRTLPNGVKIYVSPDAQLKYLKSKFDDDLIQIAETNVTDTSVIWDIGANCGVFSFSCDKAKEVIAVEADPFLCHLLQESIALNGARVSLVCAAAWSSQTMAEFSIAQRGRASNHLSSVGGRSQTGGERARILLPTITLDALLDKATPPTFIKIDVEGAETEVLRGATRLLREFRPAIYMEIGEAAHADCAKLLQDAGYTMTSAGGLNWLCLPD